MKNVKFLRRALFATAVAAILTLPVIATTGAWNWTDRSELLPVKDGVSLSLAGASQGMWLLSDGLHVYKFDGTMLTDFTTAARQSGISTVAGIFSGNHSWLVTGQSAAQNMTRIWQTDGMGWLDVTSYFPQSVGGFDADGQNGTWYARSWTKATNASPSESAWSLWQGSGMAQALNLPLEISRTAPGCFMYLNGSKICSGVGRAVSVNGSWYLISGTAEAYGLDGTVTQTGTARVWTVNGTTVAPSNIAISHAKFISGIWTGNNVALVATSNAPQSPFVADHLWVFDGMSFRDVSDQALAAGLLGGDAREMHAAWNGKSWMILAHKNLVQFDGTVMTAHGQTRDLFDTVTSDGSGLFVLTGAASDADHAFATSPLTAKLVTVREDLNAVSVPTAGNLGSQLAHNPNSPTIAVVGDPVGLRIGNGRSFTLSATADDASGIDHIAIFVNGARVKVCLAENCSYQQTYWTNGEVQRSVDFFARAMNQKGVTTDSAHLKLWIVDNATVLNATDVPLSVVWQHDRMTGTDVGTWNDTQGNVLPSGSAAVYGVAAYNPNGINKIDVWVNGKILRTCTFKQAKGIQSCRVQLVANDYGYGQEVFVNGNIFNGKNQNIWTSATRLHRDTIAAPQTSVIANPSPAPASQPTPEFYAQITLTPSGSDVTRGALLTVHSQSQNSILGLTRVDVYVNGQVARECQTGAAVSPVSCDVSIDTSVYIPGTVLSVAARAEDYNGHEQWSATKAVTVRTQGTTNAASTPSSDMSVWSWLAPTVSELTEGQTATYSVGAWSIKGLSKVDMIVDGSVRRTCTAVTSGTTECAFTISPSDYSHGHVVTVNARATDRAGRVAWTDANRITIKREWTPLNVPGPDVTIVTDHPSGYAFGDTVTFTARGWSPNGLSHLDVFVNGIKVAICASDVCSWMNANLVGPSTEYQARLVDGSGQETWTPLQGIVRK